MTNYWAPHGIAGPITMIDGSTRPAPLYQVGDKIRLADDPAVGVIASQHRIHHREMWGYYVRWIGRPYAHDVYDEGQLIPAPLIPVFQAAAL
jgi:hypothetical protein